VVLCECTLFRQLQSLTRFKVVLQPPFSSKVRRSFAGGGKNMYNFLLSLKKVNLLNVCPVVFKGFFYVNYQCVICRLSFLVHTDLEATNFPIKWY